MSLHVSLSYTIPSSEGCGGCCGVEDSDYKSIRTPYSMYEHMNAVSEPSTYCSGSQSRMNKRAGKNSNGDNFAAKKCGEIF